MKLETRLGERNIAKAKRGTTDKHKADYTVWDSELKGFGLRVRDGRTSWVLQYQVHGRQHRIKLGDQQTMTADKARSIAKIEAGKVEESRNYHGSHPMAQRRQIRDEAIRAEAKRPGDAPFSSRIEEYLAYRQGNGKRLRESSLTESRRYLEQTFRPLHNIPLAEIRRVDVANVLSEIKSPSVCNRARSTLSTFFGWAIQRGWFDVNPVANTVKAEEAGERQRALSDEEVATLWLNAPDNSYGTILKLLLLTGCRRNEIGGLMRSEIDWDARTITIPSERTKNKQEHVVPLSDMAMSILSAVPVREGREHLFGRTLGAGFAGWSGAKAELDARVTLKEPWTIHDTRRTVRTGISKLGTPPHVCEAVLNHKPEKLIRTYDRNDYLAEKREALNKWAQHIKVILAQASGANVTALKKKQH